MSKVMLGNASDISLPVLLLGLLALMLLLLDKHERKRGKASPKAQVHTAHLCSNHCHHGTVLVVRKIINSEASQ